VPRLGFLTGVNHVFSVALEQSRFSVCLWRTADMGD
jgi:hypothetical protein